MKLYRIHITYMDDPLKNQSLFELVSPGRREKVIRYRMPDDRKRCLGAGIILRRILQENGLTENDLRYSENEKPVADSVFFNVSHAGDYVVGVSSDCEVGCDIEKIRKAPMEIAQRHFRATESAYIQAAPDRDKAFFAIWTLKESYMKMTGKGMSLPLDSFEIVRTTDGFALGKSPEKPCFFKTMEFDGHMFAAGNEKDFAITESDFEDIHVKGFTFS